MTRVVLEVVVLLGIFYFIFSHEINHYFNIKKIKMTQSFISFEIKKEWFSTLSDYENRVAVNNGKKYKQKVIPSKTKKSDFVPSWSLLGKI